MYKVILRKTNKVKRDLRVRKKIEGSSLRPRLSVYRSNKYIYGQIIDDSQGRTLAAVSLADVKKLHEGKSKMEAAFEVGKELAKQASPKKIKAVVFDRGPYRFHGRVQKLAEGAKEGGLVL